MLLVVTIIGLACFFIFMIPKFPTSFVTSLDHFTARSFGVLGSLLGQDIRVTNNHVSILSGDNQLRTFVIGYGCDGLLAYLILASAIIPFPLRLKYRFIGLGTGLVFIFLMNQIRLAGLAMVLFLIEDKSSFDFYHLGVGQLFALATTFLFWNSWVSQCFKSSIAQSSTVETVQTI